MKTLLTLALLTLVQTAQAFYEPSIGRWINRDPIGDVGGQQSLASGSYPNILFLNPVLDDDGPNLYSVFRNNPIGQIDPYGLACDSGWSEYVGIDSDPLGRFDFTAACEAHDKCYGTCGKSKADCDQQFLNTMLSECRRESGHNFPLSDCQLLARTYYQMVNWFGGGPFRTAQKCCTKE